MYNTAGRIKHPDRPMWQSKLMTDKLLLELKLVTEERDIYVYALQDIFLALHNGDTLSLSDDGKYITIVKKDQNAND